MLERLPSPTKIFHANFLKSSKHQHPSSREFSNTKHQSCAARLFEVWSLELLWMLELGIWSFSSRWPCPEKAGGGTTRESIVSMLGTDPNGAYLSSGGKKIFT
jgi:hypothetical protein